MSSGKSQDSGFKPGQKLSPQDSLTFGATRESWCAVERKKEQDWCRTTRRHHPEQFSSTVFDIVTDSGVGTADTEPRCTFQVNMPTHRERRHFSDKYENDWKL